MTGIRLINSNNLFKIVSKRHHRHLNRLGCLINVADTEEEEAEEEPLIAITVEAGEIISKMDAQDKVKNYCFNTNRLNFLL